MKISKRIDDYKIYVEDDNKNYISTGFINDSQQTLNKTVSCRTVLKARNKELKENEFIINLSVEDLKTFSNLLNEVVKHLET